jgi:hypothetical protein
MSVRDKDRITRGSFLGLFAAAPFAGTALAQSANGEAADYRVPGGLEVLNFHFSGDSYRVNTSQQTGGPYTDRLVMGGSGQIRGNFKVGQIVQGGEVNAHGSFAHYDISFPTGKNIPLKFTGTWKARSLVSFNWLGVYGTDSDGNSPLAAGVLVLDIMLVRPPTEAIPLIQVPSMLTLVSHLQPGFSPPPPGNPDGVFLLAPNDPKNGFFFAPIEVASTVPAQMEAHTPVLFSTLNENRAFA